MWFVVVMLVATSAAELPEHRFYRHAPFESEEACKEFVMHDEKFGADIKAFSEALPKTSMLVTCRNMESTGVKPS